MQKYIGSALALSIAVTAGAQVTIMSVDRSVGATACVFAPPDYPNWCESDGRSNTSAGNWVDGVNYGISAAGGVGYGSALAASSNQSLILSDHFEIHGLSRAEVDSDGECSATCSALTSFTVHFKVVSPCRAVLSGDTIYALGSSELRITLRKGDGTLMYTYAGNYAASFDLAAGEYTYFASGITDGSCAATCSHKEYIDWTSRIDFQPLECPADFNNDDVVDDADFVYFAAAYNDLVCPEPPAMCPADLNGDGIVEDSDFVIFVAAYNELLCP